MIRWIGVAAVFLLTVAAVAGETKITGYLIGSAPEGTQAVVDALNVKLKADLDVKLDINYIGWNELNSKYPLVLAGSEDVDWIYTADWAPYASQAVRGAFKELTPELLQRTMPLHWAATPGEAWKQAMVNGKIFMVPSATPDRKVPVAMIRGDLRKQYGLPPVTSIRDLEPYLAAVKRNAPGMIPINLGNGYDIGQPFFAVLNPEIPPISGAFIGTVYGNYEDPRRSLVNFLDEPYRTAFQSAATVMKRWYDKGYFNRAPFANTELSRQAFVQGKSAVGFGNSQDIQEILTVVQAKGWEPEILPILSSSGHSKADTYTGNGVAIVAGSKNADLALRVLDLIMEDPDYARLAYLGLEGKNWMMTPDGRVGLPPGLRPETNSYPIDAAGFWFVNKGQIPPLASWSPAYLAFQHSLDSLLVPNVFHGFTFVTTKVKNEVAAITTVMDQYWAPLAIGAVTNVDRAVNILEARLAEAGQARVTAELKTQLAAYFKEPKP